MTPAILARDGILRRVNSDTWEGIWHGYRVQVFHCGGRCFAIINSQSFAEVCPWFESFAEGALVARGPIEQQAIRTEKSVGGLFGVTPAACKAEHTAEQQRQAESGRKVELTPLQKRLRGS
jgi:hypothetical protein